MENNETKPTEAPKTWTPEQLRMFGKRIGAAPSTITGWIKDGPPPMVQGMCQLLEDLSNTIFEATKELSKQDKQIAELETTIRTMMRLGKQ